MPQSPHDLLAVLNRMIICLRFIFGMLCGLAQEVTTIYKLLQQNQHKYFYGTVFENGMCKAICNGISEGYAQFFSQHKSNYDIQNNRFATVDLSATRMILLLNMSNNNGNYPIFQSTFPTFPQPQQQQQHPKKTVAYLLIVGCVVYWY